MPMKGNAFSRKSSISGQGLFASNDIPEGELIFAIKRPLIAAVDYPRLADTCSNCFKWTAASSIDDGGSSTKAPTVKACTGCRLLRYCSKKCQAESWMRHHKHECSVMGKFMSGDSGREVPHVVRAVMQILLMRSKKVISDDEWGQLLALESHFDDFRSAGGRKFEEIKLLANGAWTFSGTQLTVDLEVAETLFTRLLSNSLTLVTPTFDPLGISLDPFAALANHSCDPNAVVVMNGPELSFRSLRLIEKDKEILISYIDITNPIARRQAELEERYFFECDCSKCQLGQSEKEDKWALPPEQLPEKWAKAAEAIIANEPSVLQGLPSFDTADNNLEAWKRLAALQYTAFAELEHARQLDDIPMMTQKLEGGMVTCFQSKMWPLYRQPYAALRDDLIVAYLTSGEPPKFVAAFQHAVRRYFEIDPILYPQPFHPVRVVHIWTLLMLALWLASAPEDCPMDAMKFLEIGIDLGVVIFNLLLEANAEVHKSHGRSSKFAQTVLKKFEEVRMDMSRGDPRIIDEVTRRREEQWKTLRAFGHETEV